MAGSGKGGKKNDKGKSYNVYKAKKNKHGSEIHTGQKQKGNTVCEKNYSYENMLEQLLIEKVELLYKKASDKLLDLGYGLDVATRAILMNGSIFGGPHVLFNIFSNALDIIKKGHITDGKISIEPIFDDVNELARFSMQTLINMVLQDELEMSKMDAILYLLQSNSLSVHISSADPKHSEDNKDLGNEKGISKIDIGKMLEDNMASLQGLHINTSMASTSQSELDVATFQSNSSCFMAPELSSDAFDGPGNLEFIKNFTNCLDGVSAQDWLRTCPEDSKDDLILKLTEHVEKLSKEVKEKREWAKKTVVQVAKRINVTRMELRELGLEKTKKQQHDRYNLKMSEREAQLSNIKYEIGIVNQVKDILEARKQEKKGAIISYNVSESESEKSLLETQRREKKMIKRFKDTEKNVDGLRRLIIEEKQKLVDRDGMESTSSQS